MTSTGPGTIRPGRAARSIRSRSGAALLTPKLALQQTRPDTSDRTARPPRSPMTDPSSTPMMSQYRALKARDPDALLLFRMGDFYEMFGEDAERAAALLGLALTTRDKGPNALPMAGFPHPALESYLAKLVAAGQRAAVCEQAEDPKPAKGLGRSEEVQVVTPRTLHQS